MSPGYWLGDRGLERKRGLSLAEALKPWRDRMNLSKICSDAIAKELSILADLPAEVQEFTDLIDRLRAQKAESRRHDYQAGFEGGVDYARHRATYDDLIHIQELIQEAKVDRRFSPLDLILGSEVLEDARADVFETMREIGVTDAQLFWDGWLAGVRSVWQIVRDKV